MRINKGLLVQLHYQLNEADNGAMIEETKEGQPLEFIYGMGLMLPAFEAELAGLQSGDKFDFVLSPDNAYGQVNEDLKVELPRDVFLVDGKFDSEVVFEGAIVPMNTADGQVVEGLVTKVGDELVSMDFNHDLAGKSLHFTGYVQEVHEPTQEEYNRYFGHHHGCSGCGCDHHAEHHHGCSCDGCN